MLTPTEWRRSIDLPGVVSPQRVITHADRVWIVHEADMSLAPDAPRTRCLLCESALAVRRAWTYPRDWARLADSELLALFA